MASQLSLRWTSESLLELYQAKIQVASCPVQVYVESLDGIHDEKHVAKLLESWGIELRQPERPVLREPNALLRFLGDDQYFPGYDTIWLLPQNPKPVPPPPFITWYATEAEDARVIDRSSLGPACWQAVSDWMQLAGAWTGLSQGVKRLEISLP